MHDTDCRRRLEGGGASGDRGLTGPSLPLNGGRWRAARQGCGSDVPGATEDPGDGLVACGEGRRTKHEA